MSGCPPTSAREWTRLLVGIATALLVVLVILCNGGRLEDDLQYCSVVGILGILVYFSVTGSDAVKVLFRWRESFEEGVQDMQSIPWKVYGTLVPSLDRLTAAFRGDQSVQEIAMRKLVASDYRGIVDGPSLRDGDGKVRAERFKAMKLEYKRVAVLLCRMKALAPNAHDALIKSIGECSSVTPDPVPDTSLNSHPTRKDSRAREEAKRKVGKKKPKVFKDDDGDE